MCDCFKCLWRHLKEFKNNESVKFWSILLILFIIVLIYVIKKCFYNFLDPSPSINAASEVDAFLYFVSGVATCILAVIAYFQLKPITKDIEGTFLLEILKLWESPHHIDARQIIEKTLKKARKESKSKKDPKEDSKALASYIKKYREDDEFEPDAEKIKEFLNLLETIGYFHAKKFVTLEQIETLFGSRISNYGQMFSVYFEDRAKRHKENKFEEKAFEHFQNLIKAINEKRENSDKN